MASNLKRSKRTVGKRIDDLHRRVLHMQKRPAPRRIGSRVIVTTNLTQDAVTNVELAPNSVTGETIAPNSVTADAIEPGTITNDELAPGVGGINSTFSSTQPASPSVGDVWFDSSDGLKLKRYDGTNWVSMQDLGIAAAAAGAAAASTAATAAQTTANGKNKVFYAASAPTAVSVGDLWFDTAQENKLSKWNGSAWEAFGLGNAAFSNIDAGKITAGVIAAGRITSASIAAADIDAARITAGVISSARITSASISAADINADRITAGTITGLAVVGGTVTSGTFDGFGDGLRLTGGFIQGSGSGVKIKDWDGSSGATQFFKDQIYTNSMRPVTVDIFGSMPIKLSAAQSRFQNDISNDTLATIRMDREYYLSTPGHGSAGSSGANFIVFFKNSASTPIGRIGYLTGSNPSTLQFENLSDARLKEELDSDVSALSLLNALKPKYFKWINDDRDALPSFGLFAQEAYEVLPNLVTPGGSEERYYNEDMSGYEAKDPWMLDYSKYVPYLIKAVQELSAKVAELESR